MTVRMEHYVMKYMNPIIPGYYPDPSVCRVGDWFYLVTSTFEYFPGVPIFRSCDMVHWEQIGHCLTRPSQLPLDKCHKSGGIFAPTIRNHNGRFYMVTTNVSSGGNFYVYTDDIMGEWSEPIWVNMGGIDPTLYFDSNGKNYIVTNEGTNNYEGHIVLAEIDIETGQLLSEKKELWQGTGGKHVEAPHIYFRNGYYYLLVAEGGTSYGHMVTVARSRSIWGPYEASPYNPVLTHRERHGNPIQATGHGDLVEDALGNWWITFLGIRPLDEKHHLGRETFLAPVEWQEDGWFTINSGEEVQLTMDVDRPWPCKEEGSTDSCIQEEQCCVDKCCDDVGALDNLSYRDTFDSDVLGLEWNFLRNPIMENYITEGVDGIVLKGTTVTLEEMDTPTWLGRRQQHFDCEATIEVDLSTLVEGDEVGLSAFYGEEHHYDIRVLKTSGMAVQLHKKVGDMDFVDSSTPIEGKKIVLKITADKELYTFSWGYDEASAHELGTGRTSYLSSEVANGKFTGTYFAMYVISNHNTDVTIKWFDLNVL